MACLGHNRQQQSSAQQPHQDHASEAKPSRSKQGFSYGRAASLTCGFWTGPTARSASAAGSRPPLSPCPPQCQPCTVTTTGEHSRGFLGDHFSQRLPSHVPKQLMTRLPHRQCTLPLNVFCPLQPCRSSGETCQGSRTPAADRASHCDARKPPIACQPIPKPPANTLSSLWAVLPC